MPADYLEITRAVREEQRTRLTSLSLKVAAFSPVEKQTVRDTRPCDISDISDISPRLTDPRPDLTDNSRLWTHLLRHATLADDADAPIGAYGALHGIRCCGARLAWQQNGTLRIVPGPEYRDAWEGDRQTWLLAHRGAIAGWLDAIAHVEGEVQARRAQRVGRQAA